MAKKYHAYSGSTSDGLLAVTGYSHKQLMKFLLPKLMAVVGGSHQDGFIFGPKKDQNGAPVVGTIEHAWEEIADPAVAAQRGLKPVLPGDLKPYQKNYIAAPAGRPTEAVPNWMWHGGLALTELDEATQGTVAANTAAEADALEARVKSMRASLAAQAENAK